MKVFSRSMIFPSIFFIGVCLVSNGCTSDRDLRKEIRAFYKTEINLPEHFLKIQSGKISDFCDYSDSDFTYVQFYGVGDCSDCAIEKITAYERIFELCDSLQNVTPLIIFSPSVDDMPEVIEKIVAKNFSFPLFIDDTSALNDATVIPVNPTFHSFLLSKDKHPVMVGNPIAGDALKSLFVNIVSSDSNI